SIATLFQIQEHMNARSRYIPNHEDIHTVVQKFLGAFAKLYPQLSSVELSLYLQVGAATIAWTAEELNKMKVQSPHLCARREDKEAFIRKTFTTLRAITELVGAATPPISTGILLKSGVWSFRGHFS